MVLHVPVMSRTNCGRSRAFNRPVQTLHLERASSVSLLYTFALSKALVKPGISTPDILAFTGALAPGDYAMLLRGLGLPYVKAVFLGHTTKITLKFN